MRVDEELTAFAENLRQEVISRSELDGQEEFRVDAFTEILVGYLTDAGELDDAIICYHKARGEEVSGYAVSDEGDCLDLIIAIHTQSVPPGTVTKADVETAFKRVLGFLARAMGDAHGALEEASPAHDMALTIHGLGSKLQQVRLFLITDGRTTEVKRTTGTFQDIPVSYHVWDIERLFRCATSGQQREPIEIDFREMFGDSVPCLPMPGEAADYRAYLAIMSGDVLARLYDEYGPRLLERNVRSYLQAKGKVNRGIQQTIKECPERFLAYNNGISVTAAEVRLEKRKDGSQGIVWARDLQIVNGGQTTASIHHAMKRDRADVSQIHVQAKLSVIDAERVDELVPLISRYANSQNKVNEADFFANDQFHVGLEKQSRSVWAPAAPGTHRQTRWFYERARGQYQDAKGREPTPARKREFSTVQPTSQKFTKTDLAKFENTWDQLPQSVSLGAEKNFRVFTTRLAARKQFEPDQRYFERLVAKAILFRRAEKIVQEQEFGGYRANIVTYSLALILNRTSQRIDLERIWRAQDISPDLSALITSVSRAVHASIVNPPSGKNVTEWCKREDCWNRVQEIPVVIQKGLQEELLSIERVASREIDRGLNGADRTEKKLIEELSSVPAETWFKLSRWAKETGNLDPWQRGLAYDLGRLAGRGKDPSPKQAKQGAKVLSEARKLGFEYLETEGVGSMTAKL
jgi:hypothetical protein